ncbi:hypothetical protein CORC01_07309 [Colletotrichum orchidophilum]|uniref:C3H1-type domain-containing protein n=1 Tax=Colletotrichum orchidophilum TaxID=1209926 RepID=A0A1G4B7P0_9PEZI|nr:uncharacterized protein CORC01_07309 [Colletotrichum orchidophilum]OHE97404.1 hypothetical protein CORC01_07309 [Colletotrichum orchidophilum]
MVSQTAEQMLSYQPPPTYRGKVPKKKRSTCRHYLKGRCYYTAAECNYAHREEELSPKIRALVSGSNLFRSSPLDNNGAETHASEYLGYYIPNTSPDGTRQNSGSGQQEFHPFPSPPRPSSQAPRDTQHLNTQQNGYMYPAHGGNLGMPPFPVGMGGHPYQPPGPSYFPVPVQVPLHQPVQPVQPVQPMTRRESNTICWNGASCRKPDCWYRHDTSQSNTSSSSGNGEVSASQESSATGSEASSLAQVSTSAENEIIAHPPPEEQIPEDFEEEARQRPAEEEICAQPRCGPLVVDGRSVWGKTNARTSAAA